MINETLLKVQQELKAPKTQYNSFGKYKYRSCEDILEALKPILAKYNASVTLSDEALLVGDWHYVKATATLYNGEECFSTSALAREEQTKKDMDAMQITGTASSYARKYALNGLFAIDDVKDADTLNTGDTSKAQDNNEPLTYESALELTLTFGKYNGKSLKELYHLDQQYVIWLIKQENTEQRIKDAVAIINSEIAKRKTAK